VPDEEAASEPSAATARAVAIGFEDAQRENLLDQIRALAEVTPTKDLESGLAAARELGPDVILVAAAPGTDPLDLLMAVRREPELRTTPVVTLSVDPDPAADDRIGDATTGHPGGRDHHQVAQALQRMMLDDVMKVSYILASAANSGIDSVDRQVLVAINRLDEIAMGLRDAVIDLRRGTL
jgi:hypothetical protein